MKIEPVAWMINHTGELISEDGYEPFWKAVDGNTPLYAIPDTHVIVPREPTQKTLVTGMKAWLVHVYTIWRGMIEAAEK